MNSRTVFTPSAKNRYIAFKGRREWKKKKKFTTDRQFQLHQMRSAPAVLSIWWIWPFSATSTRFSTYDGEQNKQKAFLCLSFKLCLSDTLNNSLHQFILFCFVFSRDRNWRSHSFAQSARWGGWETHKEAVMRAHAWKIHRRETFGSLESCFYPFTSMARAGVECDVTGWNWKWKCWHAQLDLAVKGGSEAKVPSTLASRAITATLTGEEFIVRDELKLSFDSHLNAPPIGSGLSRVKIKTLNSKMGPLNLIWIIKRA